MQITYVVSSMVFWGRENALTLEQDCEYLKLLGFGIELLPTIRERSECRYNKKNWSRLQAATQGMAVSLRSRNDNPTVQQWREQIECAKLLNANIVMDLESFGIPEGVEINGSDYSAEVVKIAEENKVMLCLETGSLKKLIQIGEKFDSIRYCLDAGYANLDRDHDFKEYVDKLGERVMHLHLSDNYGESDDHEAPGLRGGISRENWKYLLSSLEKCDHEIIGSLEMCPCQPGVLIRRASDFLFDELGWPGRPDSKTRSKTTALS